MLVLNYSYRTYVSMVTSLDKLNMREYIFDKNETSTDIDTEACRLSACNDQRTRFPLGTAYKYINSINHNTLRNFLIACNIYFLSLVHFVFVTVDLLTF